MCTARRNEIWAILIATNTTELVVEMNPEKKNSGLYEIWIHDLCDTGIALYQLRNKPTGSSHNNGSK